MCERGWKVEAGWVLLNEIYKISIKKQYINFYINRIKN